MYCAGGRLCDSGGNGGKVGGFQCFGKVGGGRFHSGGKGGAYRFDMFAGGRVVAAHFAGYFAPALPFGKSRPYFAANGGKGGNGGGKGRGGGGSGCGRGFKVGGFGGFGRFGRRFGGFLCFGCFGVAFQYGAAGGFGRFRGRFGGFALCGFALDGFKVGGFQKVGGKDSGGKVGGFGFQDSGGGGAYGVQVFANGGMGAAHFGGYCFGGVALAR